MKIIFISLDLTTQMFQMFQTDSFLSLTHRNIKNCITGLHASMYFD